VPRWNLASRLLLISTCAAACPVLAAQAIGPGPGPVTTLPAVAQDVSPALSTLIANAAPLRTKQEDQARREARLAARAKAKQPPAAPREPVSPPPVAAGAAAVEQTVEGSRPAAPLLASFDGLGFGLGHVPPDTAPLRNPSDNSLAVGPDDIVQVVNSRFAIFSRSGELKYGPTSTRAIFAGFPGECGQVDFGDVVARYDQLARRWVFVLPIFERPAGQESYAMCYAVSAGDNLLGRYYRYEFSRALFPDYPRLGVWTDGYYLGTSTGDTVIQKHACVAERSAMLRGRPAREQCSIIDGVNFLNPADIDGRQTPPRGTPNLLFATGGTQLHGVFDATGIDYYSFHADWKDPARSRVEGPYPVAVAPYHYLCNGQLTSCVPQPGTSQRLDAQGDKLMQRVVYRRIGKQQSIVAAHSVDTRGGGGGVRWYEFRLQSPTSVQLYQQGTYVPGGSFRWMPSIGMDRVGNMAVGYSHGDAGTYVGQRLAGRLAGDHRGDMTLAETRLVDGAGAQTDTLRWEDYTTLSMDPADDCTFWYVGDYYQAGAEHYSSRIGAVRLPGCH